MLKRKFFVDGKPTATYRQRIEQRLIADNGSRVASRVKAEADRWARDESFGVVRSGQ